MRRLSVVAGMAVVVLALWAAPVTAAELTPPCTLEVHSFDAGGGAVDSAFAPGARGTQTDPFRVVWDGSVDFRFDTGVLFTNNHWTFNFQGIPVLNGRDDNPTDLDEIGNIKVGQGLPFRLVGLFNVSGDLWGNNDATHCAGNGWIYLVGDPIGTIPWILAVVLLLAGLLLLVVTPYVPWEDSGRDTLPTRGGR